MEYNIRRAEKKDLKGILGILKERELTTLGVEENLNNFLVAEKKSELIGVIGWESSIDLMLLRSMAVKPEMGKKGIAGALVAQSISIAKEQGLQAIYLLTNTAQRYFAKRGFKQMERKEIPKALLERSALNNSCPQSSICMKLDI